MITASVGVGTGNDAYKAGVESCMQALSGILPSKKANILFVFGSTSFDQDKLMEGITSISGDSVIVGCSTAGEISSEGFYTDKSVVVLAIFSDQVNFFSSLGNHIPWNPKQAGETCANTLEYESHGYITSALVFLDILSGNGDLTLSGFTDRLGSNLPVFGGAAGDNLMFFETFQYFNGKAYKGSIVSLGLSGDYHSAGVAMHGFLPIGISRKVTKSSGTTLYELDGKPASSIYEEYFGEENLEQLKGGLLPVVATSYPLGVFMPESNDVVLRNPVFVDQKGAITFTASIPEGSEIRLMISDIERGFETTELVASQVLKKLEGRTPKAVIVVNSISRKKMFGSQNDEEIRLIQKIFGREVPIAGFYGYAQIGGKLGDQIPFHNGSLLIWALAE